MDLETIQKDPYRYAFFQGLEQGYREMEEKMMEKQQKALQLQLQKERGRGH